MTAVMPSSKEWEASAYCRTVDPEVFYNPETEAEAVDLCHRLCPVRKECLEAAIDRKEKFGVWGGTTELERRQINTPRQRVKCPHCSSTRVFVDDFVEICLSCGLSWPT
jgi:WhiB family redox-sensing transcriptional regulator